jgi:hypothetical protein
MARREVWTIRPWHRVPGASNLATRNVETDPPDRCTLRMYAALGALGRAEHFFTHLTELDGSNAGICHAQRSRRPQRAGQDSDPHSVRIYIIRAAPEKINVAALE